MPSPSNRKTCVWPPETTSAVNVSGTAAEGPPAPSTKGESACPSMWFTGTKGTESPSARPFPSERPTSRAPTRPGPAVAATAVTSARLAPASASAASRRGGRFVEMRARRDLGHDAAEAAMSLLLRRHAGGARAAGAVQERDGRLVAGRLEAENERVARLHRERRRAERVRVRRRGDSSLRHDRVDQDPGGHVEGGIERGDAVGREGRRASARQRERGRLPRPSRSSIGIDAPSGVERSTVVVGAATTNGTPCARHASARPYVPILFATSPFAAMRSAPTTTAWTRPPLINEAAATSGRSLTSSPSCVSSHAVRREPWRNGRVSSARIASGPVGREHPHDAERGSDSRGRERPRVAVREDRRNAGDARPPALQPRGAEAADREAGERGPPRRSGAPPPRAGGPGRARRPSTCPRKRRAFGRRPTRGSRRSGRAERSLPAPSWNATSRSSGTRAATRRASAHRP